MFSIPAFAVSVGDQIHSLMTLEELEYNYDVSGPYVVTERIRNSDLSITIKTQSECGSRIVRTFTDTGAHIRLADGATWPCCDVSRLDYCQC